MIDVAMAPVTVEMLRSALEKTTLVRVPATIKDYDELSDFHEFSLHFVQNQIVATMSYCTESHELVVANLVRLLGNAFEEAKVMDSNRPVFVAATNDIFEPDIQVVFGETDLHRYGRVKTATKNPVVLVEVHSKTTKDFDLDEKLEAYKTIPTLQHIVFADQNKPRISIYTRTKKPNEWLNADYSDMSLSVRILGKNFPLSKIYSKVIFNV